jgi:hypothetical protein
MEIDEHPRQPHKATRGYDMKPWGAPPFKRCGKEETLIKKRSDRAEVQKKMVSSKPSEKSFIVVGSNNTADCCRELKKYENRKRISQI